MGRMSGDEEYRGFEQGPIRPPSEAGSLLLRVTRNCPWNRCSFCPVYKGSQFSLRPLAHVLEDIERVQGCVEEIRRRSGGGDLSRRDFAELRHERPSFDRQAMNAALHWAASGMRAIFLQDANSLVIKPRDLLAILRRLRQAFPWVERITSYARSRTVARIADDDLAAMAEAGLSRIHIGMESGSDRVLARVGKGVDKQTHILAGQKVKRAGMELSEYLMPGLGGRDLWREHAMESADALNAIDPHFIRLRSLAIPNHVELYGQWQRGEFVKLTDDETARELLLFLERLDGIHSTLASDHILNLFEDLHGRYPEDKERLAAMVRRYLQLPAEERMLYQVGRRMGLYRGLGGLADEGRRHQVTSFCRRHGITPETVDMAIDELMKRFI